MIGWVISHLIDHLTDPDHLTVESAPALSGKGILELPALPRDAVCHKCAKKGHYSSQYFSKVVTEVTTTHDEVMLYNTSYLDAFGARQSRTTWSMTATVDGQQMSFKLDTGAEVTVLSEGALKSLNEVSCRAPLCSPDNKPLDVVGELSATLEHTDKSCVHPVFILQKLQQNLLGLLAIQALKLLMQMDVIRTPIPDLYPALFSGLGTFPDSYTIKLKPGAQPFALFMPRNIPITPQKER